MKTTFTSKLRKTTIIISALMMLSVSAVTAFAEGLKYDLNGDGKFDVRDVAIASRAIYDGKTDQFNESLDVDNDGKVDNYDIWRMAFSLA